MNFFESFDLEWGKRLSVRRNTFRAAFDYLAKKRDSGHLIVETGCARQPDNWEGDGQSTYLFDQFANAFNGNVISVDIDPKACAYARSMVGPRTQVYAEDSLPFLRKLAVNLLRTGKTIDLLYLDSFDWQASNPTPSAVHHLKELCVVWPVLTAGSLVVIDDSFRTFRGIRTSSSNFAILDDLGVDGKAKYVAEFFAAVRIPLAFEGYQCGWIITKPPE